MNRIVFWLAIIGLAFLVWRVVQLMQRKQQRWRDQRAADEQGAGTSESPGGRASPEQLRAGEPMLKCSHCGVYLPASEALERRGLFYCSPEHRDFKPA